MNIIKFQTQVGNPILIINVGKNVVYCIKNKNILKLFMYRRFKNAVLETVLKSFY